MFRKVTHGVLRGLRAFWIGWFAAGAVLVVLLSMLPQLPAVYPGSLGAVLISLPLSLIAHEYGHARTAVWCRAGRVRIERQGLSVAISHEEVSVGADTLIALSGPLCSMLFAGTAMLCGLLLGSLPVMIGSIVIVTGTLSALPIAEDGRTIMRGAREMLLARSIRDL